MKVEEHHTSISSKRKKRGVKLVIAYILQGIIFFVIALTIVLMVCGVLYIKEHLAHAPDRKISTENTETDGTASSKTSVIPATPIISEEITVVLDAGHGGIQSGCEFDGVLEKDITLSIVLLLQEKLESEGLKVIRNYCRRGRRDRTITPSFCGHR